jgi:methionyl-tRNA synthetase
VGSLYGAAKFKAALQEVRRISQRVNQYLNERAPWKMIAEDRKRAANTVYVALQAIDWLKIMWAPILPHSSEQLHRMLGYEQPLFGSQYTEQVVDARGVHEVLRYDHTPASGRWEVTTLQPGQRLLEPSALFIKLDDELMAQKLGVPA